MGLACPVCEIPHQDATHLANHLAFTALTHGGDHEAWLDDNVPEWADDGEAELAAAVEGLAPDAEYEQLFDDTVHAHDSGKGGHRHSHDDGDVGADSPRRGPTDIDPEATAAAGRGTLDEEARSVLEEARGLTAAMVDADADAGSDPDPSADTDDDRASDGE
jgi:hypothetical protein